MPFFLPLKGALWAVGVAPTVDFAVIVGVADTYDAVVSGLAATVDAGRGTAAAEMVLPPTSGEAGYWNPGSAVSYAGRLARCFGRDVGGGVDRVSRELAMLDETASSSESLFDALVDVSESLTPARRMTLGEGMTTEERFVEAGIVTGVGCFESRELEEPVLGTP